MRKIFLLSVFLFGCNELVAADTKILNTILDFIIPDEPDKCGCETEEPTIMAVDCKEVNGKMVECSSSEATHKCCGLCMRKLFKVK